MHDQWTDRLSEYLDEELPPDERAAIETHLAGCAECTRTLTDLRRVVAGAGALKPVPPAHDLWRDIADRTVSAPSATGGRVRPIHEAASRRISFTLPQLAAAGLLLAAVSVGVAWNFPFMGSARDRSAAPPVAAPAGLPVGESRTGADSAASNDLIAGVSFADEQYDAAVADLEKALADGRGRLDESTVAIVENNLEIINLAIEQARRALESDPANSYLSGHLFETRRKKLDLLRRAAALAAEQSQS